MSPLAVSFILAASAASAASASPATSAWTTYLSLPVASLAITLGAGVLAQWLYARRKWFILNPVLVSSLLIIGVLSVLNLDIHTYEVGTEAIKFWLGPAVVALGVALYQQRLEIARQALSILPAVAAGCVVGLITVTVTAAAFGATRDVVISAAPKSVTTPIAVGIATMLGGDPSLAAMMVIFTGISGAVFGPGFLRLIGVRQPVAYGLAIGAASHGIGTARAMEDGQLQGAAGGLAIGLHGLFAALLAPVWIRLFWPA